MREGERSFLSFGFRSVFPFNTGGSLEGEAALREIRGLRCRRKGVTAVGAGRGRIWCKGSVRSMR